MCGININARAAIGIGAICPRRAGEKKKKERFVVIDTYGVTLFAITITGSRRDKEKNPQR